MKVFKETTKTWSTPVKNHTYILSDDKRWLYGMVAEGRPAREVKMFKNRIGFDTRYRTFKEIK
jgi:hypothetical protein